MIVTTTIQDLIKVEKYIDTVSEQCYIAKICAQSVRKYLWL